MTGPLTILEGLRPDDVPDDAARFLRRLGRPTAIRLAGRDRTRSRAVTTLLHGNEPSGFRAVHAWLRGGSAPAVDTLLIVANVEAALAAPGFAHRMLPGRRDLNRCFLGPFDDVDGALAAAILEELGKAAPEALIDIHNNTGHNPAYGVGVDASPGILQLVSLFGDRFVLSHLRLGALMEAVLELPSATVEVGRSGDPAADALALRGLTRFLEDEQVVVPGLVPAMRVLSMPMRVGVREGVALAVADEPVAGADLTVLADLDRHNFETIGAGEPIGWTTRTDWPLELRDEDGIDRAADYFALEAGRIVTRLPIVPIMITTDPHVAEADCLFYIVRDGE